MLVPGRWRTIKRPLAIAILGITIASAAMLISAPTGRDRDRSPRAESVSYAQVNADVQSIGALGRIEPRSELIDVGAPADARLAKLMVEEGDDVVEGQLLGYLRSFNERVAVRNRTAARLAEAQRLLRARTAAGRAEVREAEIRLERAEKVYPFRVQVQEAEIRQLEAKHTNNLDILESAEALLRQATQTRRRVEDQRALVREIEGKLDGARKELARLHTEQRMERLAAQAALDSARADLFLAETEVGIDSLRSESAIAKEQVELATLRAPINGRILKISAREGERIGDRAVLTMGDVREMHAVAEVYETDIGRVRVGQKAVVRSSAFAGALTGTVVKIGNMIFKNDVLDVDPASRVDARVVEVRVRLDDSEFVSNLTNLTVDVVIFTGGPDSLARRQE